MEANVESAAANRTLSDVETYLKHPRFNVRFTAAMKRVRCHATIPSACDTSILEEGKDCNACFNFHIQLP